MPKLRRNQLERRIPIQHFGGKFFQNYIFRGFGPILVVILVWVSVICGICEEVSMVSAPLGFEVSGYERKKVFVSENGLFAFGFIDDNLKDDGNFAVGIWYSLENKTANVPVWTAGGGVRVSENSTITLSMDGCLTLFDNGVIVWSSDTKGLGVQSTSLLNNGNLVLLGSGGRKIWESFNYPTNTLLPGQSLHYPQSLHPSISSHYSLVMRRSGELALMWENNLTYWNSRLGSTTIAKEARFESNGVLGLIDGTGATVWFKSSESFRDPSVVLRHLRIDSDGNLRIYSWDSVLRVWRVGWQAIENQCKVFGSCGLYSFCGYNSGVPTCACLSEDSSNTEEGLPRTHPCNKMVDIGNCKEGTSMSTLKHTVFYGLYPPHDVGVMLNQEACKEYCSNDTSCVAATSTNDGSGLCMIQRTRSISGYHDASNSAVSFLKVCLVPLAVSASQADLRSNATSNSLPSGQNLSRTKNWKSIIVTVAVIVVVSACAFLGIEILVLWFIHKRRQIKAQSRIPFGKDAQMNPHYSALIRLSYDEVKELTANFKDQLGPSVFKGVLPNQIPVVAKVLNSVVASERDFRMIVTTLGATHHRNLVQLKGFCFEPKHKILLYEYIPKGSLQKWLSKPKQERNGVNWQQRLDIACGIARALAYLHSECQQCIAHGSLKFENVLLDEKLVAKLTDFGLHSLLDNDSASLSESLPERDIYMFGQMLLQILMGQQDIVGYSPQRLIQEMYHDKKSVGSVEWEGIERACRIALWCMQDRPFLRPSIGEVVKVLEGNLSADRPPPSAAFMRDNQVDYEESAEISVAI
ncbi:G-type lectin S-receptor-like serine/threonine-protein kinase SD3-1 [Thalictrum thalictroides]|uniref:Receptor-like serine/threonine-protein kinase n=1 Tax=Thalictrum thalictroides TaxID=46969 RepID=A0A7J6WQM1_THATH|nr:G-type lectin S-receptor-like serine/threonine-protein kinase SD3-1 [Thalictrum thalictroides]